ncbi:hypothetical protein K438DRAFT_1904235 [Mycena galopus ATCC 62051]|nr:hypothetical protein K438DRAFT_1904235 [Mycena galopus ATCC 62051]
MANFTKLEQHLARRSYVEGWYTHIKSTAGEAFLGASDAPGAAAGDDDDEVDLCGSDEENDTEAECIKAERVAEYSKKKAGKPKPVAKSVVTLDVKPWDDEADMEALEKYIRSIEQDGLLWGQSKLVAIGYGIKKLQINLVVEDQKISTAELEERIAEFEDYVQSTEARPPLCLTYRYLICTSTEL